MIYLGSNRIITNPFSSHGYAEDYAGDHLSNISINGTGKVIKVIDRFKSHEDSINYNDYLNNKNIWKDGNYYNCTSISGKKVKMHFDELGGNQIYIETYYNNQKVILRLCHLDSVLVKPGDIINKGQIIAHQGNTGLVLSNKSRNNITYGSHVHLEVTDKNNNYLNPRGFADGSYSYNYLEQTNTLDASKKQIRILVDKINIRENPSELSNDIGDVFINEIYDVLDIYDSNIYTWYKIKTNLGLEGYVAGKKDANWVQLLEPGKDVTPKQTIADNSNQPDLIFTCPKDDYYYIKLYKDEKLYLQTK